MKNYASKNAKRGRVAYRTPSRFIARKAVQLKKAMYRPSQLASRAEYGRTGKKRR